MLSMTHNRPAQTRVRRTIVVIGLALLACRSIQTLSPLTAEEPSHPYAVTGYWLFGRGSHQQWRDVLAKVHDVGGDTVIQFGPRLRRVSLKEFAKEATFADCRIDGRSLVEAIPTRHNGERGLRIYGYNRAEAEIEVSMSNGSVTPRPAADWR